MRVEEGWRGELRVGVGEMEGGSGRVDPANASKPRVGRAYLICERDTVYKTRAFPYFPPFPIHYE